MNNLESTLQAFAVNQMSIGGIVGSMLKAELAEMAIQDEFTGLENRLARDLRQAEEKPFKVETVVRPNSLDDELSGDYYNDKALFFKDGTVEVVSYKGEGEYSFQSEADYREWASTPTWHYGMEDDEDYYEDEE